MLEIGIGGYEFPDRGGESLRMWKDFFPRARIFGADLFDKSGHQDDRIQIFQGSQNDPEFLRSIASKIGRLDVVIDDGSHVCEHIITTFNTLFPLLPEGGIYVIEDTQTSYWDEFGGSDDPDAKGTTMDFVKQLIDGLNWEEFRVRQPGAHDRWLRSVSCYHNLVFIVKGRNEEGSNKDQAHIVHG